jgi:hypothetical protein
MTKDLAIDRRWEEFHLSGAALQQNLLSTSTADP